MIQRQAIIVEPDVELRQQMSQCLMREGFLTIESGNCKDALLKSTNQNIDLIVTETHLNDGSGLALYNKLSPDHSLLCIFISHDQREDNKLLHLQLCADDFLIKPFSLKELSIKVHVLFRRLRQKFYQPVQYGPFALNQQTKIISVHEKTIPLTRKEYQLMAHFMLHKNQVFNREHLLQIIWGIDYLGDIRTVDSHVKKLRNKLDPEGQYLQTVWGIGYVFKYD